MGACIAAGIALSPPSTTGASASCRPRPSCETSSAWRVWARAISRSATPTSSTAGATLSRSCARCTSADPELTFDCTTKVEHVLEHAGVWEEMAASGCLFVVSALETVNDEILARLDKGHNTAQAVQALDLLREHGIETRPSFMPFTPWTTPRDVLEIVDFVAAHDLVANVDPVQYTIRLLVPEGSLLLEGKDLREHLGPYDAERLSYPWRSADPAADRLQGRLSALVQQSAAAHEATGLTFARIRAAVREATGEPGGPEPEAIPMGSTEGRPRLTEPWFC